MEGVSSRTRSRNATRFQSLDDIIPYKRRKKVLKNVHRKKAKHVVVDLEKGNKSDDVEGSDMSIGKGGTFNNDRPGSVAERPIILDSDSGSASDDDDDNDDHVVNRDDRDLNVGGDGDDDDDDDCKGLCSSSDDDFEGSESSSSEESRSSYDDEKEEEEEEEVVMVVRKWKNESNGMRRCTKDGGSENKPSSVNNDESGVEDQEELKHGVEDQDESGVDDDHDVNRDLNDGDDDDDDVDDGDDDDDDCKVLCSSSDEKGTSDDDFEGSESSSSEESCSSYDDDDDDDEKEEEEVVVRKVKNEINGMRRCTKDGVNERKHEKVEEGDFEKEKELWEEMDISLREEEEIDSLVILIFTS